MTQTPLARQVMETEAAAILALAKRLDHRVDEAATMLRECQGRIIVTGMGKSGLICRKIAATFSSIGAAAFFLHPAEAIHGDLGVIQANDVVLALSYSGETDEILRLLETIRRLGARLVAMTGSPQSTLGRAADITLDCHVSEEACPLNLVPTASTTAMLALGDALAMTVLVQKGFRQEDFASLHPGGMLGKRLLRIGQLMHAGDQIPVVEAHVPLRDAILEMTSKGLGMTCVVRDGRLTGVITDGDLRRHMSDAASLLDRCAGDVMTPKPITLPAHTLAAEALRTMEERKITSIVVSDDQQTVEGILHLHDLWRTQMF